MPIMEAQLRHIARTERNFQILITPTFNQDGVWWCLRLRLQDHPREYHVVDGGLAERRWRQINAAARFIIQSCGKNRQPTLDLRGVTADMLFTKGQGRIPR